MLSTGDQNCLDKFLPKVRLLFEALLLNDIFVRHCISTTMISGKLENIYIKNCLYDVNT